ncbi:hypothetical protein GCM10025868_16660 [Angustibacter aerolatus]|uniref:Uncharacterized protein n=1 Tax=Angustibacter aerolatus TaxID=1162965 RepID=A0ABQ6JFS5_9ACTN|nr:hypothetical protein GCM10025868_16660 [Angustibacter aerolatus]
MWPGDWPRLQSDDEAWDVVIPTPGALSTAIARRFRPFRVQATVVERRGPWARVEDGSGSAWLHVPQRLWADHDLRVGTGADLDVVWHDRPPLEPPGRGTWLRALAVVTPRT